MKRKIVSIIALVLALCTLMATGAMAASVDTGLTVRVNGYTVSFPDGQPYIDENSRTMIPVRFVTEQLGAKVSWNGNTETAIIEKDGICVEIPIGSDSLSVTENGKTVAVKMDTASVLKDGRTYVPIRYVSEALGAYVEYSDLYKTVGIYSDTLTAAQIEQLRTYDYTLPDLAIDYETAKARYSADELAFYYGTSRASFTNYANAREYLYHVMSRNGKYYFKGLNTVLQDSTNDKFYDMVVQEAVAEVNYNSANLTIEFNTDTSCIYQADNMDRVTCAVRGIAVAPLHVKPTDLTGAETALLCRLGYTQLYKDMAMSIPVDIHMNTQPNYQVNIHTIVPLGAAY
jgi:hypothetical protein